jgi:ferritin-like protein
MIFGITFKRDFHAAKMLVRCKSMYYYYTRIGMNIQGLWEKTVSKDPRKTALIEAHTGKQYTFDDINQVNLQKNIVNC